MTEAAMPPATGIGQHDLEDADERLDTDPEQEPNAPNREPEPEFVRHDLKDDSDLDKPSDDDELDRPDNPNNPNNPTLS